jgi:exodeoxyribonuclease V alpha subunit
LIEDILEQDGLIDRRGKWYRGQPVMVNQNDYALRLFNGDVGLIVGRSSGDRGELLQAQFPITEGSSRFISLARLPPHETAYANTVHKVQGSEFEQVLLILPPQPSQVLTRELIYTAVTRARTQLEIWSTLEIMEYAVSRKIERNSGLREVLKCHEATDLHLRPTIAENGK